MKSTADSAFIIGDILTMVIQLIIGVIGMVVVVAMIGEMLKSHSRKSVDTMAAKDVSEIRQSCGPGSAIEFMGQNATIKSQTMPGWYQLKTEHGENYTASKDKLPCD